MRVCDLIGGFLKSIFFFDCFRLVLYRRMVAPIIPKLRHYCIMGELSYSSYNIVRFLCDRCRKLILKCRTMEEDKNYALSYII